MTCIGQSNLCVSSGYVHETCTHQMIHGAYLCSLQVIQRSLFRQPQLFYIPELLFDSRGYFSVMTVLINYIFQFLLHGSGNGLNDRTGDENCDDRTGSKSAAQGNTTDSQQDVQCHPHIFHRPAIFTCQ